ncbi:hypothetical protein LUZ60_000585 [Juncus effusus]|nr:hypothetical protein LUZ60_000585 [Juncus effusus]
MAEKEGAIVTKGHDESLKLAFSILEEFGLPTGLLPLTNVIESGYVKETGYFWIIQENKLDHYFTKIRKYVSYETEITGYIEEKCIKNQTGVKGKEMMIWMPIVEMTAFVHESNGEGKMQFKSSIPGITRTFPIEAFQIEN